MAGPIRMWVAAVPWSVPDPFSSGPPSKLAGRENDDVIGVRAQSRPEPFEGSVQLRHQVVVTGPLIEMSVEITKTMDIDDGW